MQYPAKWVDNSKQAVHFGAKNLTEREHMQMNYYVLQVTPREEEKTEAHIRKIVPDDLYDQCFHPTRLMRKKFHGKWMEVREKLLPGYVFITTENAQMLYLKLKNIPLLTKMLGKDLEYFVRLSKREEEWLELLLKRNEAGNNSQKNEKNEVGLSRIDITEGNQIRVVSGPLKDMEGMVKKINLHKMIAEVEVPFMNGSTVIHLGVEMVEKSKN